MRRKDRYDWDGREAVFYLNEDGKYGSNEIKLSRLMYATKLKVVEKVRANDELLDKVLELSKIAGVV
jgi:hypothetical protein